MQNYWKGKRVLVTGGSGFIGSWAVEELVERGARVTSTYLHDTFNLLHLKGKIKLIKVDLLDPKACLRVVKNHDIVLHLASKVAGIQYTMNHPVEMFEDNVEMAKNVLHACHAQKVKRILVVSSACVYRRHAFIPTLENEGFIGDPEDTNLGYGWSKRVLELMARFYHQEYGMHVVIARPYNTYGPRDDFDPSQSHVIPGMLTRIYKKSCPFKVWGSGKQTRSFIYVEDCVRGLLKMVEKAPPAQPVNLGSDQEISIKDLATLLLRLTESKSKIVFDKSKPDGQPRRVSDTKLAQKMIGFKAETPLEVGLKKTITWYKKQRSLSLRATKSKALKK